MRLVENIIQMASSWVSNKYGANRGHVTRAALSLARSETDDAEACKLLREQTLAYPDAARQTLRYFAMGREGYERDRACRLLEAVITGTSVKPIDPRFAELFSQEEQLGRVAIGNAFAILKKHVPQLEKLEANAKREIADSAGTIDLRSQFVSARRQAGAIVGPTAAGDIAPLARSQLALTITVQYFAILYGDSRFGDMNTSFFSAPAQLFIRMG